MRQRLRAVALALLSIWFVGAGAEARPSPAESMRDLRRLQDRIATGDTVAEAAHAKAIQRTAQAFSDEPLKSWKDTRNARALVIYLFSGGSAPSIGDAIPKSAIAQDFQNLYAGALAYGMGDDTTARTLLMPIDPKTMANGVGGHLALVQATLASEGDPKKAIALLDVARLLEPGTLVEEAALRKEMSLIGGVGDLEKFALLSRRYLSAFRHSIYAENFRQLVATSAVKLGSGNNDQDVERLTKLLSGLDRNEQRRLYLMIARDAVVAGRTKMATLTSEQAGRIASDSKADEARAMAYYGAAAIVSDRYELGMKALSTVQVSRLEPRDQALRTSALAVADMIRKPPTPNEAHDPKGDAQAALVSDAERSIANANDLLKSLPK